jgi:AcrR family transcriptional regulator
MDKPTAQSPRNLGAAPKPTRATKPPRSDGVTTQALILQAARRRLCEGGYAQLNLRDIAKDAGVNHALINYHFRSKQQLVLAVVDEANAQLLERQKRMYDAPTTAGEKWQQACDFYEQDLKSGFVRLMMELMGASFNDEELQREFVPRLLEWIRVVEGAATDFIAASGLELPVSARALSTWICFYWVGMEAGMTLGITEKQGHFREALDAVATLLRRVEAPTAPRAPPRRAKAPTTRSRRSTR